MDLLLSVLCSCAVRGARGAVGTMADEELMFSMEGVGSVGRGKVTRDDSVTDDDEDYYICPITDDPMSPTKEICDYLKNLVHEKQLSATPPKTSFTYKVKPAAAQGIDWCHCG